LFVPVDRNSNFKGNVAEAEIVAAALQQGLGVLKPVGEHGRYDLVFDVEGRLVRVQCKWARLVGDVVVINLAGYRYTSRGQVRSTYSADEVDVVAAYCEGLDRCFLLPIELVAGMRSVQLRVAPPRNGQRAALHWATDYEFPGAIAQLGERLRGTQEVAGSSPASSIRISSRRDHVVGAHEFRERFGWYVELAARGAEILITRRGTPYAVLASPAVRADAA
jgi:prevent-host-death family protein